MRIVCIADLQGMCKQIKLNWIPDGDMLLVAGDLAGGGTIKELEDVNKWLGKLPHKYKVIVAGNHDQHIRDIDGHTLFTNATYLQDELVEIEGIKIYGSPANEMNELKWYGWAFCEPKYLKQVAKAIPEGLDILLTHGGPYGILDELKMSRQSCGSRDLLDAVIEKEPKYHVFGHIHEAHGTKTVGKTTFINAALPSERNQMRKADRGSLYFDPIIIEI